VLGSDSSDCVDCVCGTGGPHFYTFHRQMSPGGALSNGRFSWVHAAVANADWPAASV
jgi:hypothetical protein